MIVIFCCTFSNYLTWLSHCYLDLAFYICEMIYSFPNPSALLDTIYLTIFILWQYILEPLPSYQHSWKCFIYFLFYLVGIHHQTSTKLHLHDLAVIEVICVVINNLPQLINYHSKMMNQYYRYLGAFNRNIPSPHALILWLKMLSWIHIDHRYLTVRSTPGYVWLHFGSLITW